MKSVIYSFISVFFDAKGEKNVSSIYKDVSLFGKRVPECENQTV